jgi:hypothetical protein
LIDRVGKPRPVMAGRWARVGLAFGLPFIYAKLERSSSTTEYLSVQVAT